MTSSSLKSLNVAIDAIDLIDDVEWQSSLDDRKKAELEFHDRDRDSTFIQQAITGDTFEKFYGNKKYYACTYRSAKYIDKWLQKNVPGDKIFLDYACGNGKIAIDAAKAGASLSLGLDISSVSVRNAKIEAKKLKLENVRFFQADAENTHLPDNSIDLIVCSGMLHHLDLSYAFPELRRILKPGGKILAIEALDYNPLIKLYRMLTPDMRTDWEKAHILSFKDIAFASHFFVIASVRFWHVIGYISGKFPFVYPVADRIDQVLERIPFLRRMAWIFTFELVKPQD
jgi:SAM-dependent methyltransferase